MQVRLEQKLLYFASNEPYIMAVSKTGESFRFHFKGESEFTNSNWVGCQVGRSRFFQVSQCKGRFRILKMDPTQRCFSIERERDLPIGSGDLCYSLAHFKDEFVFLISTEGFHRYSLTEDKCEKFPRIPIYGNHSACSLGDKVYVLDHVRRVIKVLHDPDAPVSSQEMFWQDIEVPGDVPYRSSAFAPLNSTEIVIAGGMINAF